MKAVYIQNILNDFLPGWGTANTTTNGINISTQFAEAVQKFISEQPAGQFTAVRGCGDVNVRQNREVTTVCTECGSPEFYSRVIEDLLSYIDPCHKRAKPTKLVERKTYVICVHCGTPRPKTVVHRYPEVGR